MRMPSTRAQLGCRGGGHWIGSEPLRAGCCAPAQLTTVVVAAMQYAQSGLTSLHYAASRGDVALATLLLDWGANTKAIGMYGMVGDHRPLGCARLQLEGLQVAGRAEW